jgi:hypothetical protein
MQSYQLATSANAAADNKIEAKLDKTLNGHNTSVCALAVLRDGWAVDPVIEPSSCGMSKPDSVCRP